MKRLTTISFAATVLLIVMAFSINKTENPSPFHSIEGTWELTDFHNYDDGVNISETVPKSDGYRQVKMFYNGKIMWTRYSPKDSVEYFGYGSYVITQDQLIETLEYGSAAMMKAIDTMRVFSFELVLKDDTYSQINLDENGERTFSENYKRID